MGTPDVLASDIMDTAASLLNDTAKSQFTYIVQLPFLKRAIRTLREQFELNNVPVTNETSAVLTVAAGVTNIGFSTTPALPSDLIEIQQLWERATGIDPFVPMTRQEYLPHYLEGSDNNQFLIWAWEGQAIILLPCIQSNDLKIDYIAQLFNTTIDQNSNLGLINCQTYLECKTAALCARFIGENPTRADTLDRDAQDALDTALGISTKGRQAIATRHRPFRAGWKSRGLW